MAKQVWSATGRRKRSSAQVTLTGGTGIITINGVDVNDYMPYATLVMDLKQPLTMTNNENKFDITVNVKGGGFSGQTGAITALSLLFSVYFKCLRKRCGTEPALSGRTYRHLSGPVMQIGKTSCHMEI